MGGWSEFAAKHWPLGGIATSLLWFVAGQQFVQDKKLNIAILWQCVAVMIAIAMCGWALVKEEWLGLVCGIGVLYIEVRSIRRILRDQAAKRNEV
jgi:hypothetical protein